jgi:hypothetical protein
MRDRQPKCEDMSGEVRRVWMTGKEHCGSVTRMQEEVEYPWLEKRKKYAMRVVLHNIAVGF